MEPNLPTEQTDLAPTDIKQQLEIDKLNAEIRELNKSWYKKPVYLAAMLPAFVAIVSVIILYFNGNFEVKNKELQVKKEVLDLDIRKFEIKKDSLAKEIKKSEDTIRIYKQERLALLFQKDSALTNLKFAKDSLNLLKTNKDSLSQEFGKLKKQLIGTTGNNPQTQKTIERFENLLLKSKSERLLLIDKYKNLNYTNLMLQDKINELKMQINLSDSLINEMLKKQTLHNN